MATTGLELDHKLCMAMHPSNRTVPLETIEAEYSAKHFRTVLRHYVTLSNSPQLTVAQVKRGLWDIHFPF
jgi:hypothetical protein